MPVADELEQIVPGVALWRFYDPSVKADLFSTALITASGVVLVDPIPLSPGGLAEFGRLGKVAAIVVTNANHTRSAVDFANEFSAPIFAHPDSFAGSPTQFVAIAEGETVAENLKVIEISGAAPGEIALYQPSNCGTIVVGDALINFEPYGFTFLPSKYCADAGKMRQSLRKLLLCEAERMLFAHGLPLVSAATARLEQLVGAT